MRPDRAVLLGALFAGLAVALGAFGAHALKDQLDARALEVFDTGVRYQLAHSLALLACAALGDRGRRTGAAAWCFTAGIVLFSGSLYGLALADWKWLGPVTPLGGVAFLAGWVALAVGARARPAS